LRVGPSPIKNLIPFFRNRREYKGDATKGKEGRETPVTVGHRRRQQMANQRGGKGMKGRAGMAPTIEIMIGILIRKKVYIEGQEPQKPAWVKSP